jgi:hypothetical protein
MTLVRKNFPNANAAEFSNIGGAWCNAVYNATGLAYDPSLQTCLFDDSWSAGSQHDRRRLGASAKDREANISEELDKLKTELKAVHAEELETMVANVTALMALQALQQEKIAHQQKQMVLQQEQIAHQQKQRARQLERTSSMLEKFLSQQNCS